MVETRALHRDDYKKSRTIWGLWLDHWTPTTVRKTALKLKIYCSCRDIMQSVADISHQLYQKNSQKAPHCLQIPQKCAIVHPQEKLVDSTLNSCIFQSCGVPFEDQTLPVNSNLLNGTTSGQKMVPIWLQLSRKYNL